MATWDTGPCECVISWDPPTLTKCGKPGTLRKKYLLPWGVIMCDDCYEKKEAKNR